MQQQSGQVPRGWAGAACSWLVAIKPYIIKHEQVPSISVKTMNICRICLQPTLCLLAAARMPRMQTHKRQLPHSQQVHPV
jgi:hypothetical protein